MRDICINSKLNALTKFTSSSRITEFKDMLPWNISEMIKKTIPISMKIVISYVINFASCFEFIANSMETETATLSEFPNEGKVIIEQVLVSENRNKSKRAGL